MGLLSNPIGWLERRYTKRTLARAVVALLAALLASQVVLVWYFGSVGLSFHEMGYASDDRTVVIDSEDHAEFARHYNDTYEEGWCLYGQFNDSHIRITDVVHASALSQGTDRIQFTCIGETAGQVLGANDPRLVGAAHSHPSMDRSYMSHKDSITLGRTSPVIEVMGIYTDEGGIEFYTVRSITSPLEKDVR